MTTPNEELRKLLEEALRTQTQYTMVPNIGRMNFARAAKDALLDRIDRLEAENEEHLKDKVALAVANEAKDKLLVQARDALRLSLDKDALVVYTQIKNHLKGTP